MSEMTPQTMKPETAAKKLGVYLPATPEEFQQKPVTRAEFLELQDNPPEWLAELRRTGPHPRPVMAAKLGVSISGLARGGFDGALTTDEIKQLLAAPPAWLVQERATQAHVRDENARIKSEKAEKRAQREKAERHAARLERDAANKRVR